MIGKMLLVGWTLVALIMPASALQAQSAKAIVDQAAKAMGGISALRAIKNEAIESEGKQFDSSSTSQPLGPTRQISTFRYTLTRDLTQPRLRLEWDGVNSARNQSIRFIEVIDGDTGSLREGAANTAKTTVIYLPAEKIIIEADHISPRKGEVRPATAVREFVPALDKLNLDVVTIVGIHGDSATMQAARAAAQAAK